MRGVEIHATTYVCVCVRLCLFVRLLIWRARRGHRKRCYHVRMFWCACVSVCLSGAGQGHRNICHHVRIIVCVCVCVSLCLFVRLFVWENRAGAYKYMSPRTYVYVCVNVSFCSFVDLEGQNRA